MTGFFVFITLCVAVATLSSLSSLHNKSKQTDQKIDSLNYAISTLHHKVDSLQHGTTIPPDTEKTQAAQPVQEPQTAPAPAPTPTPTPTHIQSPPPTTTHVPAQPAIQTPAHPTPQPAQAMAARTAMPARKNTRNMEKIIGKNVLPFLAAGMVFIGLIFLAILVVPAMSDFQRFIAMFALSGAIFLVGFILARHKKNIFAVALLGTGVGALFISILMTRIYFNYLGDIPTFALLLIWMIVCMALVKMFSSLTLSITAHVGMVISIIFAFTLGFDQQRTLIVIAYQIVATIVIVGGSLLAYRKTYRLGLLASLALTVVATIAIRTQDLAEFSVSVIVTSLLIQFVTATVLSFFLATSSAKLSGTKRIAFHYANKALWIILTVLALWPAVFHGLMGALKFDNLPSLTDKQSLLVETIPALACIAAFVIHALISVILERSIGMPANMVRVSVISTLSAGALMALYQMITTLHYGGSIPIPFLFVFALIALGITRLTRDQAYTILATALLSIETIIAATSTNLAMSNMPAVLTFIWIAAIMATSVAIWASWQPVEKRHSFTPTLVLLNLIFFELTIPQAVINVNDTSLGWAISLSIVLLILMALRIVNVETRVGATKDHHALFALNEYSVALAAIITVGVNGERAAASEQVLLWIAALLVVTISLLRIVQSHNVSAPHPQPIQYLSSIALTLATQAPLWGLMRLGEGSPFIASVVAMFVALVLVGMGFALRLKPVRLYGLGLTIFAVFKLTTYDLSDISSVSRVVAFIVGGLIAFGISALYNYADKRLNPNRGEAPNPSQASAASNPQMPYPAMPQGFAPQMAPQTGMPQMGVQAGAPQPMMGSAPAGYPTQAGYPVPTGYPTAGQMPMPAYRMPGYAPMPAQPAPGQQPIPGQQTATPGQQPMAGQPSMPHAAMPQTGQQAQAPSASSANEEDGR